MNKVSPASLQFKTEPMKTNPVIREDLTTDFCCHQPSCRGATKQTLIIPSAIETEVPAMIQWRSQHNTAKPLQVLGRIARPLLIFGLRLWWDRQRGRVVENQQRRAIQLRELLTQLGPYQN